MLQAAKQHIKGSLRRKGWRRGSVAGSVDVTETSWAALSPDSVLEQVRVQKKIKEENEQVSQ